MTYIIKQVILNMIELIKFKALFKYAENCGLNVSGTGLQVKFFSIIQ